MEIAGLVGVCLLVWIAMRFLMRFGSRRAQLEVRAITGENFAIVLAGFEIVQFVGTSYKIEGELDLPSMVIVPVLILGLALAVLCQMSRQVVVGISLLGIVAGLVDVLVSDGILRAAVVFVGMLTLLATMLIVRQWLPAP